MVQRTQNALDRYKSGITAVDDVLREACTEIASNIGANRVSIWTLADDQLAIDCVCFYLAEDNAFTKGQRLAVADFPKYFETIISEQIIVAPDARTHVATRELTEAYFEPNEIYSLLDFIIHHKFKPAGVICVENAQAPMEWRQRDIDYLRAVATAISFRLFE